MLPWLGRGKMDASRLGHRSATFRRECDRWDGVCTRAHKQKERRASAPNLSLETIVHGLEQKQSEL